MTEWKDTKNIQKRSKDDDLGGTMRLGSYPCLVDNKSMVYKLYNSEKINERHRHRFEVNNKFVSRLKENNLIISGMNTDLNLVEMIEIKDHPWFVAVQFHPELKSRINNAHPLFKAFIKAALDYKNDRKPS